jgi:hypothetical protein
MGSILGLCQWLATTSVSIGIRESICAYPIVESVHVLGLTLFMGLLVLWDCRLLGITLRSHPAARVWKQLIPWIALGAIVMTGSGVLPFWSDPVRFYGKACIAFVIGGILADLVSMARTLLAGNGGQSFELGVCGD